jgi:hypothetical protein
MGAHSIDLLSIHLKPYRLTLPFYEVHAAHNPLFPTPLRDGSAPRTSCNYVLQLMAVHMAGSYAPHFRKCDEILPEVADFRLIHRKRQLSQSIHIQFDIDATEPPRIGGKMQLSERTT